MLIKLIEIEDDYTYYNQHYSFTVIGLLKDNIKVRVFVERPLTNINEVKVKEIKCVVSAHDVKEIRVLKKKEDLVPAITANHIKGIYIEKYEFPHIWLKLNNDILNKDYHSAIDIGDSHILIDPSEFKAVGLKNGDFISINYRVLNLRAWSTIEDYQSKEEELRKKKEKKDERLGKKKSFQINDFMRITIQKEKVYGKEEYELRTNLWIKDKQFYCGVDYVEFPAINISRTVHPDKIAKRREWFMSYPENVECPVTDIPETALLDKTAEEYDSKEKERMMRYTTWSKGYKGIQAEQQYEILTNNLQIWYEKNYDTRLLRSHYAFKLLIELCKAGDPLAKKVFKNEIVKRILSGYPTVTNHLLSHDYVKYLTDDDILDLIHKLDFDFDQYLTLDYKVNEFILWTRFGKYLKNKRPLRLFDQFSKVFMENILADSKNVEKFCLGLEEIKDHKFCLDLLNFITNKHEHLEKAIWNNINFLLCLNYFHINNMDKALNYYNQTKHLISKWRKYSKISTKLKSLDKLKIRLAKFWSESSDTRDFMKDLKLLIKLPLTSSIDEILTQISRTGGYTTNEKNKIFQYLRKIQKQYPEHYYTINEFLKSVKKTKFKTFRFIISDAFSLGALQGGVKLFLNNKCILSRNHVPSIGFDTIVKGIDRNINTGDGFYKEILAIGCGHYGCCPGLIWRVIHKNDYIIIDNITWDSSKPEECIPIEGCFQIRLDDYRSEALRLYQIYKKALSKGNTVPWKKPSKKAKKKFNFKADTYK